MADCPTTTRHRVMEQAFAECLRSLDTMIHSERELQFACGDSHSGGADPAVAAWENEAAEARDRLHLAFVALFDLQATNQAEAIFSHLGFALESVVISETPEEYARMRAFAAVGIAMAPTSLGSAATPDMLDLVSEARRLMYALASLEHYGGPGEGRVELIPA